jgi:hypothetical protein
MTNAMTVAETAPPDMDAYEARRITDQIRAHAVWIWRLVADAHNRHAWKAMGYESWDAYADNDR